MSPSTGGLGVVSRACVCVLAANSLTISGFVNIAPFVLACASVIPLIPIILSAAFIALVCFLSVWALSAISRARSILAAEVAFASGTMFLPSCTPRSLTCVSVRPFVSMMLLAVCRVVVRLVERGSALSAISSSCRAFAAAFVFASGSMSFPSCAP